MKMGLIFGILIIGILIFGCVEETGVVVVEEGMQIKITYVGPQKKTVPTIGIFMKGFGFNLENFKGYGNEELDYSNDDVGIKSFNVTETEMQNLINSLPAMPIQEEKIPEEPELSIMVYNAVNKTVTEHIFDYDAAKTQIQNFTNSLDPTNTEGRELLSMMDDALG